MDLKTISLIVNGLLIIVIAVLVFKNHVLNQANNLITAISINLLLDMEEEHEDEKRAVISTNISGEKSEYDSIEDANFATNVPIHVIKQSCEDKTFVGCHKFEYVETEEKD